MASWKTCIRFVLSENDSTVKRLDFSVIPTRSGFPLTRISIRNWNRDMNGKETPTLQGMTFTLSEILWLSKLMPDEGKIRTRRSQSNQIMDLSRHSLSSPTSLSRWQLKKVHANLSTSLRQNGPVSWKKKTSSMKSWICVRCINPTTTQVAQENR